MGLYVHRDLVRFSRDCGGGGGGAYWRWGGPVLTLRGSRVLTLRGAVLTLRVGGGGAYWRWGRPVYWSGGGGGGGGGGLLTLKGARVLTLKGSFQAFSSDPQKTSPSTTRTIVTEVVGNSLVLAKLLVYFAVYCFSRCREQSQRRCPRRPLLRQIGNKKIPQPLALRNSAQPPCSHVDLVECRFTSTETVGAY